MAGLDLVNCSWVDGLGRAKLSGLPSDTILNPSDTILNWEAPFVSIHCSHTL